MGRFSGVEQAHRGFDCPGPMANVCSLPAGSSRTIFGWHQRKQKNGATKTIGSLPRTGLNHDLWAVGATYGVLKLPSDPPHWSSNGH
jgi:hypothetical protein